MSDEKTIPEADEAALFGLATAVVKHIRLYLHPEARNIAHDLILDALTSAENQGFNRAWGSLWPLIEQGEALRHRDMLHAILTIAQGGRPNDGTEEANRGTAP